MDHVNDSHVRRNVFTDRERVKDFLYLPSHISEVTDLPTFGERMKRAHRALEQRTGGDRVTLAELGQRLGRVMKRKPFSAGAVSEWESGGRTPDLETIQALADVLGVRVELLAFGRGEMFEPSPNNDGTSRPPVTRGDLDVGHRIGDDSGHKRRKSGDG
jgi:transcriptional regulator with XRE-family HTH domain